MTSMAWVCYIVGTDRTAGTGQPGSAAGIWYPQPLLWHDISACMLGCTYCDHGLVCGLPWPICFTRMWTLGYTTH